MGEHWANLDLHLDVNLDGARLGRSLEEALRGAVRDGRLPAGTRLPSSRALAADLGIARNTVGDAYAQLAAEGWLTARAGAGTWVTGPREQMVAMFCGLGSVRSCCIFTLTNLSSHQLITSLTCGWTP